MYDACEKKHEMILTFGSDMINIDYESQNQLIWAERVVEQEGFFKIGSCLAIDNLRLEKEMAFNLRHINWSALR